MPWIELECADKPGKAPRGIATKRKRTVDLSASDSKASRRAAWHRLARMNEKPWSASRRAATDCLAGAGIAVNKKEPWIAMHCAATTGNAWAGSA